MIKYGVMVAAAFCLLMTACVQGDAVEVVVAHKTVTGVKDGMSYTILVNRPGDGGSWISVEDAEFQDYFPPGDEYAIVTESLERLLMDKYSEVDYFVNVRPPSGEPGTEPYRASREIFNIVKVDSELEFRASDSELPRITQVLEQSQPVRNGVLQGTVVIGPIWPVERPGGNPPIPPEVYDVRKILVYDEHGTNLVEQVDIIPGDDYGHYSVELKPGRYVVDINNLGIDRSAEVPAEIEIAPGQTAELNIGIDTGIR